MTKTELIDKIFDNYLRCCPDRMSIIHNNITYWDVKGSKKDKEVKESIQEGVDAFFSVIKEEVLKGNRVELRNFFIFNLQRYGVRTARNPKTGELIKVKERCHIKCKPSVNFKRVIN